MRFKYYIYILLFLISFNLKAQDIRTAAGMRLTPDYFALELKQHLSENKYLNAQLGFIHDGAFLTGIYEFDYPIGEIKGLIGKFGMGAHFGAWSSNRYKTPPYRLGMDLLLGIDLIIPDTPFLIGVNWKPAADFVGKYETHIQDIGISFLFILDKKNKNSEIIEE